MPQQPEVDEEILEEGCYYLSDLGLSHAEIAAHFDTTKSKVARLVKSYSAKLKSGKTVAGDFDRTFWADVKKEAEGDVKVTFVSEKGFHHAWKSELERLNGEALMSIFEASKDFLGADPNLRFLDFPPPKGYDPLALEREVRRAVAIVSSLLEQKWKDGETSGGQGAGKSTHA